MHIVTSAVLATDVSSQERQKQIQDRFERVVFLSDEGLSEFEKTQSVVEQILLLAGKWLQLYSEILYFII